MSEHMIITVTTEQITSGDDTGMPVANLYWNQSVKYQLDAAAAALFDFKAEDQAITLTAGGVDKLPCVKLKRHKDSLKVTIKDKMAAWTNGKATLFFDATGSQQPAAGGLDPSVNNNGQPSLMHGPKP